ncbi:MAG TPA: hypothetical protein VID03_05845 [Acidimicrobiia bacterium]|jgi:hypothetical protein
MRNAWRIVALGLILAACGGSGAGTAAESAAADAPATTASPATTAAPTTAAPTTAAPATTVADPHVCGQVEADIVAAAQPAFIVITPGLGEPVCARSAVDPAWATLRWPNSPDGDDALLLKLEGGAWLVIEQPPAPDDPFRQYYFFGCEGPVEIYGDLGLC